MNYYSIFKIIRFYQYDTVLLKKKYIKKKNLNIFFLVQSIILVKR